MILTALVATAMLAGSVVPASTDGPGDHTTTAVHATADREWTVSRPGRGTYSRLVTLAALPPRGWSAFAVCIEARESGGRPGVVNSSGHAGLFQFSREWVGSLHWVVSRRLDTFGMSAHLRKLVRDYLDTRPIQHWPATYQRIGFAGVLAEGGTSAALRHWGLAGSRCNGLTP